jgi:hypothetical protein
MKKINKWGKIKQNKTHEMKTSFYYKTHTHTRTH